MSYTFDLGARKADLVEKASEYRDRLASARQEIRVQTVPDAMEQTMREAEREDAIEKAESSYRLLRQVESALSRIEQGRYGKCLKCEDPIGQKRLDALPWALFCVTCQQTVDRLQNGLQSHRNQARLVA